MNAPLSSKDRNHSSSAEWDDYRRALQSGAGELAYGVFLGQETPTASSLRQAVRDGLPVLSIGPTQKLMGVSDLSIARLLGVALATVRRPQKGARLPTHASDRLARCARMVATMLDLFEGDREAMRRWLRCPRPALGGLAPLEALQTDAGTRELEAMLGRMEFGIPE